jgi:hypothetical protein
VGNIFDKLQDNLFNTINNVFGYMVSWTPSNGDPAQLAKCLYKEPTEQYKLGEIDYSPNLFQIEYKNGDLPGLFETSRAGGMEQVKIYKIGSDITTALTYAVLKPLSKWDGNTLKLLIEKV